jgi:hypothetical protein
MEYEKIKEMEEWIEEVSNLPDGEITFEKLENPLHENQDIAAILFLYSKLKKSAKPQQWFLHGEHDVILIGQDLDIFEDFTKEDVLLASAYGIFVNGEYDGFGISASM